MVAAVIAYPKLVIDGIDQGPQVDVDKALESLQMPSTAPVPTPTMPDPTAAPVAPGAAGSAPAAATPGPTGSLPAPAPAAPAAAEDPMKALLEAIRDDKQKK